MARLGRSTPFRPVRGVIKFLSSGTAYTQSHSDTVTISEPSFLRAFTRTVAETVTITDSAIKAVTRSLSETVTLTEVFSTIHGYFTALTDNITITDTFATIQNRFYSFSETITMSEVFSKNFQLFKELADEITISDTFSKIRGFVLSDIIRIRNWLWRWRKNPILSYGCFGSGWLKMTLISLLSAARFLSPP